MIRSHALYPAELTARAINKYAIPTRIGQPLYENFTIAQSKEAVRQCADVVSNGIASVRT